MMSTNPTNSVRPDSAYARACWCAMFPHPTMATRSVLSGLPIRLFVILPSCRSRDRRQGCDRAIRSWAWQRGLVSDVPTAALELGVQLLRQTGCARPQSLLQPGGHPPHDGALLGCLGRRESLVEDRPVGRGLELRRPDKVDRTDRCPDGVSVGEVVVGTPVEDLLDDRVLTMHAVVGGPGTPAVAGRGHLHPSHAKLPGDPAARRCHELPGDLRRGRSWRVEPEDRVALVDD